MIVHDWYITKVEELIIFFVTDKPMYQFKVNMRNKNSEYLVQNIKYKNISEECLQSNGKDATLSTICVVFAFVADLLRQLCWFLIKTP